jgi:hypothetical protein
MTSRTLAHPVCPPPCAAGGQGCEKLGVERGAAAWSNAGHRPCHDVRGVQAGRVRRKQQTVSPGRRPFHARQTDHSYDSLRAQRDVAARCVGEPVVETGRRLHGGRASAVDKFNRRYRRRVLAHPSNPRRDGLARGRNRAADGCRQDAPLILRSAAVTFEPARPDSWTPGRSDACVDAFARLLCGLWS